VPNKQPKRRRLWFNDGSCIRLRPTHRDHSWSYYLVADRTSDGRPIRMLTAGSHGRVYSGVPGNRCRQEAHERGRSRAARRRVRPQGVPEHIRSDNGSEFTAKCVREWLGRTGVKTLFIEPGSPWTNGYVESFNGKRWADLLAKEAFDTLLEAKVLIERLMRPTDTN
jgi:putative transposase